MTAPLLYNYQIAPISASIFTLLDVKEKKSQNIDLDKLNETGLHKVLFILKKKIDPAMLNNVEEALLRLPNSRQMTLDPELSRQFPTETLRKMLKNFFGQWTINTRERRELGHVNKEKFKTMTEWDGVRLHTVTNPVPVSDSRLTITTTGVEIEPEACAQRVRELQTRIEELAEKIKQCQQIALSGDDATGCYNEMSATLESAKENQRKSLCTS